MSIEVEAVLKRVRGRPRIHPIKEIVEGPKRRGPPIKYNTIEELKAAKKRANRTYYDNNVESIILSVNKYRSENVEVVKERKRAYYHKHKENKKPIEE
jgi:hypothetical protein